MGNNSSSTVQVGHHPGHHSQKHSKTQDPPHRNRMKKSYLPPSQYLTPVSAPHQHPLLVHPQHLVLPQKVNPEGLLKRTSNGLILHGGGTISQGRRFNEVEMNVSGGSNCSSLVRSKGNLSSMERGSGASTPNLAVVGVESGKRDAGRRRESDPSTKIGSEISATSAKPPAGAPKQPRYRKKSNAPSIPPATAKQLSDGVPLEPVESNTKPRIFKTKEQVKSDTKPIQDDFSSLDRRERTTILAINNKSGPAVAKCRSPARQPPSPAPTSGSTPIDRKSQSQNRALPPQQQRGRDDSDSDDVPPHQEVQKRTFYFGMEEDSANTIRLRCHNNGRNRLLSDVNNVQSPTASRFGKHGDDDEKAAAAQDVKDNKVSDVKQRSDSRDCERRPPSRSSQRILESPPAKSERINPKPSTDQGGKKSLGMGQRSSYQQSNARSSISPPSHQRQDSGTFEDYTAAPRQDSSSDLSSLELDILLRPVLPVKRQELPRFSPASAWRAIESPGPGNSLSSEEGWRVPPPGRAAGGVRSGDSGISAGDSPAVPEIVLPSKKCWTPEQDLDESSSEFDEGEFVREVVREASLPKLAIKKQFFTVPESDSDDGPDYKPSLRRINYQQRRRYKRAGGLGDQNWLLSRSEPNSLNLMAGPVNFMLNRVGRGAGDGVESYGTQSLNEYGEIGYGPSSLQYSSLTTEGFTRRPNLRHVMYLPSYDSRVVKAKSVDNLNFQCYKPDEQQQRSLVAVEGPPFEPTNFAEQQTRRKYKFQSTLRVLERKQIERRLAEEAREQERERLREMEAVRRVEEEFQRKRAREESGAAAPVVRVAPWDGSGSRAFVVSDPAPTSVGQNSPAASGTTTLLTINNKPALSNKSSTSSGTIPSTTTRQEPDGAPAVDLRRELISASKRRNGTVTQELSEYRQEGQRQYWDYCRRSPAPKHVMGSVLISSSSSRPYDSSHSDVYPSSRGSSRPDKSRRYRSPTAATTKYEHPEVVCEIPASTNGSSRLTTGSASNILLLDDRSSLHGSGPSSLISDNYRRDWAVKNSGSGASIIQITGTAGGMGKRASSISSLHSAPPGGYVVEQEILGYDGRPQSMLSGVGGSSQVNGPTQTVQHTSIFQVKPFGSGQVREYRPVVFRPGAAGASSMPYH